MEPEALYKPGKWLLTLAFIFSFGMPVSIFKVKKYGPDFGGKHFFRSFDVA